MLVQVRGPKGERGWLVDGRDLMDVRQQEQFDVLFVEGDEERLRTVSSFEKLPTYVELNLTAVGFRQVRGQVAWRRV